MKMKVLFVLPVLVVTALWWAPLAMADTVPFGSEEDLKSLQDQVAATTSSLKEIQAQRDIVCGTSSISDACYQLDMQLDQKKAELTSLQAQLATLQPQTPDVPPTSDASVNPNADKGGTILPDTSYQSISDCEAIMRYVNIHSVEMEQAIIDREAEISGPSSTGFDYNPSYTDILGCAVKTGDIKLWMVPYFARYILEFIIGLAGLAAVAGIIYGGYFYLFAGLSDDQQKGKSAIKNSLIALVLCLSAWAIVNIVISLVTGL